MSANTPLPSRYPYHVYVERDTGERELSKDKRESQEGSLLYLKYISRGRGKLKATVGPRRKA